MTTIESVLLFVVVAAYTYLGIRTFHRVVAQYQIIPPSTIMEVLAHQLAFMLICMLWPFLDTNRKDD